MNMVVTLFILATVRLLLVVFFFVSSIVWSSFRFLCTFSICPFHCDFGAAFLFLLLCAHFLVKQGLKDSIREAKFGRLTLIIFCLFWKCLTSCCQLHTFHNNLFKLRKESEQYKNKIFMIKNLYEKKDHPISFHYWFWNAFCAKHLVLGLCSSNIY